MAPLLLLTYRKDLKHAPGHGYGRNIGTQQNPIWVATRNGPMSAEVVHTTSNGNPTPIEHEAKFLRDSPNVSCGDLIAKNGDVYVILPDHIPAWHAGVCKVGFGNDDSFGTELHVSDNEAPTAAQIASLTFRIQQRRQQYGTKKERIDTHRAVALPGPDIRKHDPEGWDDTSFYKWRDSLFVSSEPDWAALWGTAVPYNPDFGIPSAWRGSYRQGRPLGKAITDELQVKDRIVQVFEAGYIEYAAAATKVRLWN